MKYTFKLFQIVLLICGVFVAEADEVKTVSVMEGDSVSLNSGLTETQGIILILWRFGESGSAIAQINRKDISYPSHIDVFRGKLLLDQTGSLTINNMRTKHSGLYKLEINLNSGSPPRMTFNVTVSESPSVVDVGEAEMKSVSVLEGNSVTLQTDVTETNGDELIVWRFGDEGKLIAKHDVVKSSPLLDTDEKFRDRLQLDHQTGSLTITHTRTTDSGFYTMKISSNKQTLFKRFIVTVSAVPPLGAILGTVFAVLVVAATPVVAVIYKRNRIPERQKQIDSMKPETVKCPEGEYVVLQSDHDIKKGDQMRWTRVSVKESAIASITETDKKKTYWYDERFRGTLQLHPWTGSLIIRNLRKTDTGVYVLEIKTSGVTIYRRKYEVSLSGEVETMETVSVKEGGDVTLECSEDGSDISWMFTDGGFGQLKKLIDNESEYPDGRFRGRLQLHKQKGSLTIKNIRTEHTGLFAVKLGPISNPRSSKLFRVVFDDFTETSENESVITGFLGRIQRFCGQARTEGVFGDEKDEMKTLSEMEEGDLNLRTETEIETDDEIILRFADFSRNRPYIIIARFSKLGDEFISENWGFKDRLQRSLTGPLTITITDFRNTDSGDYNVQITNKKKNSFKSFTFIVVPIDDETSKLVMKGESINLESLITGLQKDDQILWTFGPLDMIIADSTTTKCDERFKDRVKLDKKTGSLTITESTTEDTGEYNRQIISRNRVKHKRFDVIVFDDETSVSVMEGKPINLVSPITDLQKDDQILWTFGPNGMIIADTNTTRCDERFRGRVKLDKKTGSLTITESTTEDTGEYKLQIISRNRVKHKRFDVIIESWDGPALPPPSQDQPESVYANDTPILQMQPDSSRNRKNESVTVVMPLLRGENKQEGMSSL